jgi:hypothetical protein
LEAMICAAELAGPPPHAAPAAHYSGTCMAARNR